MKKKILLNLVFITLICFQVCSDTVYVSKSTGSDDTGMGTFDTPYATINKAMVTTTSGSVVVIIDTSIYIVNDGSDTIKIDTSYVTLTCTTPFAASIKASTESIYTDRLVQINADGVKIKNLILDGNDSVSRVLVTAYGSNIEFYNNIIKNPTYAGILVQGNYAVVDSNVIYNCPNYGIEQNWGGDTCYIRNNTIYSVSSQATGMYITADGTDIQFGDSIFNNIIYGFNTAGMEIYKTYGTIIDSNTIYDISNNGIRMGGCTEAAVTHNLIHNIGSSGIQVVSYSISDTFEYNIIYRSYGGDGIKGEVTDNCMYRFNKIYDLKWSGLSLWNTSSNNIVMNNSIYGAGTFGLYMDLTGTNNSLRNNLLYGNGTNSAYGANSGCTLTYSYLQGTGEGVVIIGDGCIVGSNPGLESTDSASVNFLKLTGTSPCIDSGDTQDDDVNNSITSLKYADIGSSAGTDITAPPLVYLDTPPYNTIDSDGIITLYWYPASDTVTGGDASGLWYYIVEIDTNDDWSNIEFTQNVTNDTKYSYNSGIDTGRINWRVLAVDKMGNKENYGGDTFSLSIGNVTAAQWKITVNNDTGFIARGILVTVTAEDTNNIFVSDYSGSAVLTSTNGLIDWGSSSKTINILNGSGTAVISCTQPLELSLTVSGDSLDDALSDSIVFYDSVYVDPGTSVFTSGMIVGGNYTAGTFYGRDCYNGWGGWTSIGFNVNDSFVHNYSPDTYPFADSFIFAVNVEYYDSGNEALELKYDAVDDPWKTYNFSRNNTESWVSDTVFLNDVYFGERQWGWSDLKFASSDSNYIDKVSVTAIYYTDFNVSKYIIDGPDKIGNKDNYTYTVYACSRFGQVDTSYTGTADVIVDKGTLSSAGISITNGTGTFQLSDETADETITITVSGSLEPAVKTVYVYEALNKPGIINPAAEFPYDTTAVNVTFSGTTSSTGEIVYIYVNGSLTDTSTDMEWTAEVILKANTSNTFSVLTGKSGLFSETVTVIINVDTVVPYITSSLPGDGWDNRPERYITVAFSEEMDTLSVENGFSMTGGTDTYTSGSGTITWTGNTLEFEPSVPFKPLTLYKIKFDTSVTKDKTGNNISNDSYYFSYTTSRFIIDGDRTDWSGIACETGTAKASNGEFVLADFLNDAEEAGNSSNYDIKEVRLKYDNWFLYFMVEFKDITDSGIPLFLIAFDTDANRKTLSGDSRAVRVGTSYTGVQLPDTYIGSEFIISIDKDGVYTTNLWETTDRWKQSYAMYINPSKNIIEGRIEGGYLQRGVYSLSDTIGCVFMSCYNNGGYPSDQSTTYSGAGYDVLDIAGPAVTYFSGSDSVIDGYAVYLIHSDLSTVDYVTPAESSGSVKWLITGGDTGYLPMGYTFYVNAVDYGEFLDNSFNGTASVSVTNGLIDWETAVKDITVVNGSAPVTVFCTGAVEIFLQADSGGLNTSSIKSVVINDSIYADLGSFPEISGIIIGGNYTAGTFFGRDCYNGWGGWTSIGFNLSDSFVDSYSPDTYNFADSFIFVVTVEYYDSGTDVLELRYDARDDAWKIHNFQLGNTMEWKTDTVFITDGYFNEQQWGWSDIKLASADSNYIDKITVRAMYYTEISASTYTMTVPEIITIVDSFPVYISAYSKYGTLDPEYNEIINISSNGQVLPSSSVSINNGSGTFYISASSGPEIILQFNGNLGNIYDTAYVIDNLLSPSVLYPEKNYIETSSLSINISGTTGLEGETVYVYINNAIDTLWYKPDTSWSVIVSGLRANETNTIDIITKIINIFSETVTLTVVTDTEKPELTYPVPNKNYTEIDNNLIKFEFSELMDTLSLINGINIYSAYDTRSNGTWRFDTVSASLLLETPLSPSALYHVRFDTAVVKDCRGNYIDSDYSGYTFETQRYILDGYESDWKGSGTEGITANNGELIIIDNPDDCETVSSQNNFDIVNVRYTQDGIFYYFLVKMKDITDSSLPLVVILMDSDGDTSANDGIVRIGNNSAGAAVDTDYFSPDYSISVSLSGVFVTDLRSEGDSVQLESIYYTLVINETENIIELRLVSLPFDFVNNYSGKKVLKIISARNNGSGNFYDYQTTYSGQGIDIIDVAGTAPKFNNSVMNGEAAYIVTHREGEVTEVVPAKTGEPVKYKLETGSTSSDSQYLYRYIKVYVLDNKGYKITDYSGTVEIVCTAPVTWSNSLQNVIISITNGYGNTLAKSTEKTTSPVYALGNLIASETVNVTFADTPYILSSTPSNNSFFRTDRYIEVTFSSDMDTETVEKGLRITCAANSYNKDTGIILWSGLNSCTFYPDIPFETLQTYTVSFDTSITKDKFGNYIDPDKNSFYFKTAKFILDGNKDDWSGESGDTGTAQPSNGEFVLVDSESVVINSSCDIKEVRVKFDEWFLYFMVEFKDIADSAVPLFLIAFDTDADNKVSAGDSSLIRVGTVSAEAELPVKYLGAEYIFSIDKDGVYYTDMQNYGDRQSFGDHAVSYINTDKNIIEGRIEGGYIKRGVYSLSDTICCVFMSCYNNGGYPAEQSGPDVIDVAGPPITYFTSNDTKIDGAAVYRIHSTNSAVDNTVPAESSSAVKWKISGNSFGYLPMGYKVTITAADYGGAADKTFNGTAVLNATGTDIKVNIKNGEGTAVLSCTSPGIIDLQVSGENIDTSIKKHVDVRDTVSIDLGVSLTENGLTAGGDYTAGTFYGRDCYEGKGEWKSIGLMIDNSFAYKYDSYSFNFEVTVEYYDTGSNILELKYDAVSDSWKTYNIQRNNTLEWVTDTVYITDGYFGDREWDWADFKFASADLIYIDKVQVRAVYYEEERIYGYKIIFDSEPLTAETYTVKIVTVSKEGDRMYNYNGACTVSVTGSAAAEDSITFKEGSAEFMLYDAASETVTVNVSGNLTGDSKDIYFISGSGLEFDITGETEVYVTGSSTVIISVKDNNDNLFSDYTGTGYVTVDNRAEFAASGTNFITVSLTGGKTELQILNYYSETVTISVTGSIKQDTFICYFRNNVYSDPGINLKENGLNSGGDFTAGTFYGRDCYEGLAKEESTGFWKSIGFNIDDNFASKLNSDTFYFVLEYSYYNSGTEQYIIQYDALTDSWKELSFNRSNTEEWVEDTVFINDAYFGTRQWDAFDFKFTAPDKIYIDRVDLTAVPKTEFFAVRYSLSGQDVIGNKDSYKFTVRTFNAFGGLDSSYNENVSITSDKGSLSGNNVSITNGTGEFMFSLSGITEAVITAAGSLESDSISVSSIEALAKPVILFPYSDESYSTQAMSVTITGTCPAGADTLFLYEYILDSYNLLKSIAVDSDYEWTVTYDFPGYNTSAVLAFTNIGSNLCSDTLFYTLINDTAQPYITSSDPSNNAYFITSNIIQVTFNEPMDSDSVKKNFILSDAAGNLTYNDGTFIWNSSENKFIFKTANPLNTKSYYTLEFDPLKVRDISGNLLKYSSRKINFSTAKFIIDGDTGDWKGTAEKNGYADVSEGEFIINDFYGDNYDIKNGTASDSVLDIFEFRYRQDDWFDYFMFRMNDFTENDSNLVLILIMMDSSEDNSQNPDGNVRTGQVPLNAVIDNSVFDPDYSLAITVNGIYVTNLLDTGSTSSAQTSVVKFNPVTNVIEARIESSDIGHGQYVTDTVTLSVLTALHDGSNGVIEQTDSFGTLDISVIDIAGAGVEYFSSNDNRIDNNGVYKLYIKSGEGQSVAALQSGAAASLFLTVPEKSYITQRTLIKVYSIDDNGNHADYTGQVEISVSSGFGDTMVSLVNGVCTASVYDTEPEIISVYANNDELTTSSVRYINFVDTAYVNFGQSNIEQNLTVPGQGSASVIKGKTCRSTGGNWESLLINIDDDFYYGGSDVDTFVFCIEFEYYDNSNNILEVKYDAVGDEWEIVNIQRYGTKLWKRKTLLLDNVYFKNRQWDAGDFKFSSVDESYISYTKITADPQSSIKTDTISVLTEDRFFKGVTNYLYIFASNKHRVIDNTNNSNITIKLFDHTEQEYDLGSYSFNSGEYELTEPFSSISEGTVTLKIEIPDVPSFEKEYNLYAIRPARIDVTADRFYKNVYGRLIIEVKDNYDNIVTDYDSSITLNIPDVYIEDNIINIKSGKAVVFVKPYIEGVIPVTTVNSDSIENYSGYINVTANECYAGASTGEKNMIVSGGQETNYKGSNVKYISDYDNNRMVVNIDDDFNYDQYDDSYVYEFKIVYFDEKDAHLELRYINEEGSSSNIYTYFTGNNQWLTKTFVLDNALFNNGIDNADIALRSLNRLYIKSINIKVSSLYSTDNDSYYYYLSRVSSDYYYTGEDRTVKLEIYDYYNNKFYGYTGSADVSVTGAGSLKSSKVDINKGEGYIELFSDASGTSTVTVSGEYGSQSVNIQFIEFLTYDIFQSDTNIVRLKLSQQIRNIDDINTDAISLSRDIDKCSIIDSKTIDIILKDGLAFFDSFSINIDIPLQTEFNNWIYITGITFSNFGEPGKEMSFIFKDDNQVKVSVPENTVEYNYKLETSRVDIAGETIYEFNMKTYPGTDTSLPVLKDFFNKNISLEIPYYDKNGDGKIDGVEDIDSPPSAGSLGLAYYNGFTWNEVDVSINEKDNTVKTEVNHLSKWKLTKKLTAGFNYSPGEDNPAPNPFTPYGSEPYNYTEFIINNPDNQQVEIKIYDLSGRKIKTITGTAGTIRWYGRDGNGDVVPGGVYIYHVKAAGLHKTGTVTVAK